MNKSIGLCVLLSFVTCGIYGLYWMSCINSAARTANPAEWDKGFLTVFLLSIITCGIYGLYWFYKMGKSFAGPTGTDNSVLYLVLALFGLGLVNYIIMQDQINKLFPKY